MVWPYYVGAGVLGLLGFKFLRPKTKAEEHATNVKNQTIQALQADAHRGKVKTAFGWADPVARQQAHDAYEAAHKTAGSAGAPMGPAPPRLVQGDPLNTTTGKTYYVTMTLSVPAFMAGRDKIVEEAQNHGFVDVIASPTIPAGWPGSQTGDWYVKGTASRPSQFSRHKGVMTIVEGFEQ